MGLVQACLLALPGFLQPLLAQDCGPAELERVIVERISAEGDVILADARRLRLAGLHILSVNLNLWPKPGETIGLALLQEGKDRENKDRWSRQSAMLFTLAADGQPQWFQQRLVAAGVALVRPEADLGGCWALLRHIERGLESKLAQPKPEGGRFARVSGRVQRVGEGRSAHFINLVDASGERITGLVQKRYLKRFSDAGVDVKQLNGHFIRLRGVRNIANASIITLTTVDQIETMR